MKNAYYIVSKAQNKYLNILKTKRAFEVKLKAFFMIFKGLSVVLQLLLNLIVMSYNF